MSGYGDVKIRRVNSFLNWLKNNRGVDISRGGKHQTKVTVIHNNEAFVLPTSHNAIKTHLIEGFMKFLVKNEICTEEEFDSKI